MKLIRDDNELKAYQRRNKLRDIIGNNSKRHLLSGTQNEARMIAILVLKRLNSQSKIVLLNKQIPERFKYERFWRAA